MPLGNNHGKDRRSSSDGKTLPTGPGTNSKFSKESPRVQTISLQVKKKPLSVIFISN